MRCRGELILNGFHRADRGLYRAALIVCIEGEEQLAFFAYKCKLCSGGACVDTEEAVALVGNDILFGDDRA